MNRGGEKKMVVDRVKGNHSVTCWQSAWKGEGKHQGTLGLVSRAPIGFRLHKGLQEDIMSKLSQKTEYVYIACVEAKVEFQTENLLHELWLFSAWCSPTHPLPQSQCLFSSFLFREEFGVAFLTICLSWILIPNNCPCAK